MNRLKNGKPERKGLNAVKVAISMRSLHRPLMRGELRIIDFVKYAASLGAQGVELAHCYLQAAKADCAELQAVLQETGLRVACYEIHQGLESPGVDVINAAVNMATSLRAHCVKIMGGAIEPQQELVLRLVHDILPVVQRSQLTLCIENPKSSGATSEQMAALLKQINNPQVKMVFNMANYLVSGENPATALERLQGQIALVRAGDVRLADPDEEPGHVGCVFGLGLVPAGKLLSFLSKQGYDGWISLEFKGLEDTFFGIEASLKNLRQYLSEAAPSYLGASHTL